MLRYAAMIEIVILAVLAVIVGGALYSSLGNRRYDADEQDRRRNSFGFFTPLDQQDLRADKTSRSKSVDSTTEPIDTVATQIDFDLDTPEGQIYSQIRQAQQDFTVGSFLEGVKAAFSMISEAYVKCDRETLSLLCSDEICDRMVQAGQKRKKDGVTLVKDIVAITRAEIVKAEIVKTDVRLTVAIASRQILAVLGADSAVIDGDTTLVQEFDDHWEFSKPLSDASPAWKLITL